jgi:hypothetical protein
MISSRLGILVSVLVLASLTFSPKLAGQTTTSTPASPISDPQAIAFANKALVALTGSLAVSDVTLTGTAVRTAGSDIETGAMTLKALGTGDSRMDLATASGTRSEIRNNANGTPQGSWIDLDGTSRAMAYHNCSTDAAWFFPALSVLSQISSTNVAATYVGQETRGGASVQHLHFASQLPNADSNTLALLASLSSEDVYLDSTSLLPVALVYSAHPDIDAGRNIPVEIDFSSYQLVNGVSIPFRIQKLFNGSLFLDITIQSATLNSGLTDSTFAGQ